MMYMVKERDMLKGIFLCLGVVCFLLVNYMYAYGAPQALNYQGVLNDNQGNPVNGRKTMDFRIYDSNLANQAEALWESDDVSVLCINGAFSINLGEPPQNPFPENLFSSDDRYLGIALSGETKDIQRKRLVSVPYALNATSGIPKGCIVMWSGSSNNIPDGWALCNGQNGTPDLADRFIVGAGRDYSVAATGGEASHTLTMEEMPSHSHSLDPMVALNGNSATSKYWTFPNDGSVQGLDLNGSKTTFAGGGSSHENRPPYYALCFIMKL